MKIQHLPQGKFFDEFLVRRYNGQVLKDLFNRNFLFFFDVVYISGCGINIPGDDLQQGRFPGAISAKDCISMVFLKRIAEFAEDPLRIILFAGTGKNDFHREIMVSEGKTIRCLFFTNFRIPFHDTSAGIGDK